MILYTLYGNSYININQLESLKGKNVYVNMTNRCPCNCTFCLRQTKQMLENNSLWLKEEPSIQEILDEFALYDLYDFNEVIFCGFGEPTERLYDLLEVAEELKKRRKDLPIRINTIGLGNLMYKKDITPLFKDKIDTISISLNAPDENEFLELTRNKFGIESYNSMLDFASKAKDYVPNVVLTVVDIIGDEKIKKCEEICYNIGVKLRVRPFET